MWGWDSVKTVWQDLRHSLRMLRKSPSFTVVSFLTLALGIGANTAMFSVVNAVLIRPLPYAHSERLVAVSNYLPKMQASVVLNPDFGVWRNDNKIFEQLAAYGGGASYNLTGAGHPQRVEGLAITANLLPLLGLKPILGRNFVAEEDQPGGQRASLSSATGCGNVLEIVPRLSASRLHLTAQRPPSSAFSRRVSASPAKLSLICCARLRFR